MTVAPRTRVIGVFPARERPARQRLFDAVEAAYRVRFDGREPGAVRGLDAAIVLPEGGDPDELARAGVSLVLVERRPAGTVPRAPSPIRLGDAPQIDRRLGGRVLSEEAAPTEALPVDGAAEVLASSRWGCVWSVRSSGTATVHEVATFPEELGDDEWLKDRFRAGSFLALLPLVEVVRSVSGEREWDPPPLRAAFVIDDPNLHWPSYGFLRYADLAREAAVHGYHAGIAMVPVDAAVVHPRAGAFFRDQSQLSLLVHGNNHARAELAGHRSDPEALALAAQAWRRVAACERRHLLSIARVIAPPHGLCSEQMMWALFRVGFEAVCHSGALRESGVSPLAGWRSADMDRGGGIPGLPRMGLRWSWDEVALRAYLDQPIILVAHHEDLAEGYSVLADAAGRVDQLGPVQWMSFTELARSSFARRGHGSSLFVRAFSRRMNVEIPDGVTEVTVEVPGAPLTDNTVALRGQDGTVRAVGSPGSPIPTGPAGTTEIVLVSPHQVDPQVVPEPPRALWPLVRKGMTEGRDRLLPLLPKAVRPRRPSGGVLLPLASGDGDGVPAP